MSEELRSDFRGLDVWKKCRDIRIMIWKLCKNFPSEEKFRLADQMIRASRSATANIAEGHGRFHFQENIEAPRCKQRGMRSLCMFNFADNLVAHFLS